MERVSIIQGKKPIIFVAPHGAPTDDTNTDRIAEAAAKSIGAYAVINRGWQRGENVDALKDRANCNNIQHCYEDVVKEEFLHPIIRFTKKILKTSNDLKYDPIAIFKNSITGRYNPDLYKKGQAYIFYIHGVSAGIRNKYPNLGFIIGNGEGNPPSLTSPIWMKYAFMYLLETFADTYSAEAKSHYAGWSKSNLNQLFRKFVDMPKILSMQIEIAHQLRSNIVKADLTGETIGVCVDELLNYNTFDLASTPRNFRIRKMTD